jgi:hypothetical protein
LLGAAETTLQNALAIAGSKSRSGHDRCGNGKGK